MPAIASLLSQLLFPTQVRRLSALLSEMEVSELQMFISKSLPAGRLRSSKPLYRFLCCFNSWNFVYIAATTGSLTTVNSIVPLSAYGASKALGSLLSKWLSTENNELLLWRQNSGWVEFACTAARDLLSQRI
jgi:norsolorinic acid ketoreductase